MLGARYATHSVQSFPKVIIILEDTDVFVIFLGLHAEIESLSKIILWIGKDNKMHLIDINRLAPVLG